MAIIFKNIDVITWDSFIKNTNVCVEGDKIKKIGDIQVADGDEVINGKNKILCPGLVNAHTHAAMTLFRSYADGMNLEDWLYTKIFPAEDNLTGEDVYWGTVLGMLEMMQSGCTTFHDMYFFTEDIARATEDTGMRGKICRGLVNGGTEGFDSDERIWGNVDFYKKYNGACDGRITVGFGMHSVYTCSPQYLKYCADVVKDLGATAHIHLSETETENKNCINAYGKTPTALMMEAGVFDSPCTAAHCVHLSDEDIEILKSKNVSVAFNPSSNLKLKSGIAPIEKLLKKGINISLGTDGASSNNNLNMFEEMHLGALLSGVQSSEAFKMATVGGAKALGNGTGEIKEGALADLIMIDTDKPHFYPVHDMRANLLYSAQGSDVCLTMVGGKILYRDGEFKTADFEKIKYNAEKSRERVCK